METNQWGFHTTAHPCVAPNENGWYSDCDFQGQCVVDIQDVGAVDRFGPGEQYDINTLETFNVRLDYHDFEDHFVGYTTTMTQGDHVIELKGDCRDYLDRMTDNIKSGMAFVVSSWRPPSARWMQGDRCDEECVWPVQTTFSNLEFWTHGGKPADDVEIKYLGACGSLRAGECGDDCAECSYSYPADDLRKWNSPWAKCRCEDRNVYQYGNPCDPTDEEVDMSKCGKNCQFCNKSWPIDDPDKWLSPDVECRCVPKEPEAITYGNHRCKETNSGTCGDSCSSCNWSWPSDDPLRNKSHKAMCRCADGQNN